MGEVSNLVERFITKRDIRKKAGQGGARVPMSECALITLEQQPLSDRSQVTLRQKKSDPVMIKTQRAVPVLPK